jgi:hypothetical protein
MRHQHCTNEQRRIKTMETLEVLEVLEADRKRLLSIYNISYTPCSTIHKHERLLRKDNNGGLICSEPSIIITIDRLQEYPRHFSVGEQILPLRKSVVLTFMVAANCSFVVANWRPWLRCKKAF